MNRLLITALALAIGLTGPAFATRTMHQPEDAYELSLGQVSLPQRIGASVTFKPCPDCQTIGLPVTADTRYFVSGQPVALGDLAELVAGLSRATDVVVFFDTESRLVNRLAID